MISKFCRTVIALTVTIAMLLSVASCSKNTQGSDGFIYRDSAAFIAKEISLPSYEGSHSGINDVCVTDSEIVFLRYVFSSDTQETYSELIWTDMAGEITHTWDIRSENGDFYGSVLYCVGETVFVIGLDQNRGYVAYEFAPDGKDPGVSVLPVSEYICDAVLIDSTWVFLLVSGSIVLVEDGIIVYEQMIEGQLGMEQIAASEKGVSFLYYDKQLSFIGFLDVASKTMQSESLNALNSIIQIDICYSSDGFYVESTEGIYSVDVKSKALKEMLSWNDTDIPPSRYVYNTKKDYVLNENQAVRVNSPVTGQDPEEIVLLTHCDKNPHEGKTTITIGGYGVTSNPSILYSIYLFNSKNNQYRIHLVDYLVAYPITDTDGYLASIISDMSSGKGDDILYGPILDFPQLGKKSLVIDMMPYLEADEDLNESDWLPSILSLMKTDNALYRFFPGFTFRGYFSNTTFFDKSDVFSLETMNALSESLPPDVTLLPDAVSLELVKVVIQYGLDDFCDVNGTFSISEEQLSEITRYALVNGIPERPATYSDSASLYIRGNAVLFSSGISCPQDYYSCEKMSSSDTVFVGYPSTYESKYICEPCASVAISAGSKYPEACWEFVKIMMSDEVQQRMIETGVMPVSSSSLESMIEKAIYPETRTLAEDVGLDTHDKSAVPEESIQNFRKAIEMLNCTDEFDFALNAIIEEECAYCLNGQKTIAEVAEILCRRINIYLQSN